MMLIDGIIECSNQSGEELGFDGLISLLEAGLMPRSCLAMPQKIKDWLSKAGFNIAADDFSMLCFETTAAHHDRFAFEVNEISNSSKQIPISKYTEKTYTLDNVALAGKISERLTLEKLWDKDLAAKIEITVNEFLTNIIVHGLAGIQKPIVVMELSFLRDSVTVRFYDNGIEWQIELGKAYKTMVNDIKKMPESGRGIGIIKSICRSMKRYRYDDINETIITLSR